MENILKSDSKLDFNDILLVPSESSDITSRSLISIKEQFSDKLPIFTAPMDTVINEKNQNLFNGTNLNITLTRGLKTKTVDEFESYSLVEFEKEFDDDLKVINQLNPIKILIDTANGHLEDMVRIIKSVKSKWGSNMVLMVGNVANPNTYIKLSNAGADLIRCGIGNGNACFVEGSEVTLKDGVKPIEDVIVGDLVLTHTGEYKKVEATIVYQTDEELINIDGIICTLDHEFYVLHEENIHLVNDDNIHEHAEWIEAKNLTKKHILLENV